MAPCPRPPELPQGPGTSLGHQVELIGRRGGALHRLWRPAPRRRECFQVGCLLPISELRLQLAQFGQLGRHLPVQMIRPGQHVLDRQQLDRRRRVLHGQQALQLTLQALRDQDAALGLLRVEQCRHDPVAQVIVGPPVPGIILVVPRHLPRANARQGHRRIAVTAGSHAVFGVVPLDEDRQREPDLLDDPSRDQAHPPAVVVRVRATVQPGRVPQVPAPEVVPRLRVRRGSPPPFVCGDGFRIRVQQRAVMQAEHVAADDCRLAGQVGERDRPQDAFRLELDVVVHEQHVGDSGRRGRSRPWTGRSRQTRRCCPARRPAPGRRASWLRSANPGRSVTFSVPWSTT